MISIHFNYNKINPLQNKLLIYCFLINILLIVRCPTERPMIFSHLDVYLQCNFFWISLSNLRNSTSRIHYVGVHTLAVCNIELHIGGLLRCSGGKIGQKYRTDMLLPIPITTACHTWYTSKLIASGLQQVQKPSDRNCTTAVTRRLERAIKKIVCKNARQDRCKRWSLSTLMRKGSWVYVRNF